MQKQVEIVLGVIIIGATLAFGGVQPIAYTLMELAIFATVLVLLFRQARRGGIRLNVPIWPLLFVLVIVIEMIPLPASLVGVFDHARLLPHDLLEISHRVGDAVTLSVDPHATLLHLMKILAYLGAFVLAAYAFDSHRRKSVMVRVLIFLGLFEAAYGIIQYTTGWQKIFTFNKIYYRDTASGTFINHNHFAGLLELTFPFVFGAVYHSFQVWQDLRRRGPARVDAATISSAGIQTLFFAFLLVLSIIAILFSRSRAGILAAIFTVIFLGLLAQLKTKRKAWMLGFAVFVLVAIGYGLWIGVNPVVSRFEAFRGGIHYLQGEGRLSFWASTLGMIHDYPVVGTGLGTFRYAFPHYQTYLLNSNVTHAHSDFLEFTSDTGAVGAALLFLPIFALLVLMIRSFLIDTRRYRPSVTLGCIGATLALLIHSVADFNLHIPSNALIFAVVLGIGYKITWLERKVERAAAAAAAAARPAIPGRVHRKSKVM